MAAEVFGWLASVLTTLFAWPQAYRAARATSTEGISLASTGLMLQSGMLWIVYGVLTASPYITVANASVAAAAALTGFACRARMPAWAPGSFVTGAGVVTLLSALMGSFTTGLLGVVAAGLMTVPQAVMALRKGASLAAVSPTTYVLLATNAACWIGYGIAIGDALVIAPNCVSLPASVLILVRRGRSAPVAGARG